jgi:hypothetical protein
VRQENRLANNLDVIAAEAISARQISPRNSMRDEEPVAAAPEPPPSVLDALADVVVDGPRLATAAKDRARGAGNRRRPTRKGRSGTAGGDTGMHVDDEEPQVTVVLEAKSAAGPLALQRTKSGRRASFHIAANGAPVPELQRNASKRLSGELSPAVVGAAIAPAAVEKPAAAVARAAAPARVAGGSAIRTRAAPMAASPVRQAAPLPAAARQAPVPATTPPPSTALSRQSARQAPVQATSPPPTTESRQSARQAPVQTTSPPPPTAGSARRAAAPSLALPGINASADAPSRASQYGLLPPEHTDRADMQYGSLLPEWELSDEPLPSPRKADSPKWKLCHTKEGRAYYFNFATKKSVWIRPDDFDGEEPATAPAAKAVAAEAAKKPAAPAVVYSGALAGDAAKHSDRTCDLRTHPWYHGAINAQAAFELLLGKADGTFLVRKSSKEGCFAISWVQSASAVVHTVCHFDAGGWHIDTQGEDRAWPSVAALLHDYRETMSKHPLKRAS